MATTVNVLLVDDNPKYLKDALPYYGYNVRVAMDGMQALEILATDIFELEKVEDLEKYF